MNQLRLFIFLLACFIHTTGSSAVDDGAVGVWASPGAKFYGDGTIHTGSVLYLRKDGLGAIAAGFPPIGSHVRVAQVFHSQPLSCVMSYNGKIRPCVTRLRFRNGKMEMAGPPPSEWQVLQMRSSTVSESMRKSLDWDLVDAPTPEVPKRSVPQSLVQLMSLPDLQLSGRRLKSANALRAFQSRYWGYKSNKAFARNAHGYYGYSESGLATQQAAIDAALAYCEAARAKDKVSSLCTVVNVNDQWVD